MLVGAVDLGYLVPRLFNLARIIEIKVLIFLLQSSVQRRQSSIADLRVKYRCVFIVLEVCVCAKLAISVRVLVPQHLRYVCGRHFFLFQGSGLVVADCFYVIVVGGNLLDAVAVAWEDLGDAVLRRPCLVLWEGLCRFVLLWVVGSPVRVKLVVLLEVY